MGYNFGVEKVYKFDVEKVTNGAINWIRNWFEENGKDCNAIIGISGGKDSLIVGKLCVEALGADRVTLAFLVEAYDEEDLGDGDSRVVMRLHPALAPYKVAVLPLQKNLNEKAKEVLNRIPSERVKKYIRNEGVK